MITPFNQDYPGVTATLNGTEIASNSKDGISDFLAGRANVAMTSSTMTPQQYIAAQTAGKTPFLTVVAYDAIEVIVNPGNPLNNMTISQIKGIFFDGTITDWSTITNASKTGPIHVYALSAKSGTGSFFNKVVNGGAANNVNGSVMLDGAAVIAQNVVNDTEGIAFTPAGMGGNAVKSLIVNGITPTQSSVLDGSYELGRKLYLVTDEAPQGASLLFMNFMLSQKGQDIVESSGLIRLI